MALIHSKRSALELSHTTLSIVVAGIVITAALVCLFFLNSHVLKVVRQLYDHPIGHHNSSSNYVVPNIVRSFNNNTVMIKASNTGSNTFGSALLSWKVVSGPVTFLLDIENLSPSINSLEITITGDKGQNLLFLPYSYNDNDNGNVEFHYLFPNAGTYNVDIAFGAPEGLNFNIVVVPEEAAA